MSTVPLHHVLILAAVLFALGLVGVLVRRNVLLMLVSVEVMLNAAGMGFVAAGAHHGEADGQIMFLFVLTMAAAEVSVGLALVLRLQTLYGSLDVDAADRLRERAPALEGASEAAAAGGHGNDRGE